MKFKLTLYDPRQCTAEILDATQSCKELRDSLRKELSECGLNNGDLIIIRKDNEVFDCQDETPLCDCGICQGDVLIVRIKDKEFLCAELEKQNLSASSDTLSGQAEVHADSIMEENGFGEENDTNANCDEVCSSTVNRFLSKPIFVSESDAVNIPENLERLISSLDDETSINPGDLLVTLLYTMMLESGFTPIELPSGVEENQHLNAEKPHEFSVRNLKLFQSVPAGWKEPNGFYKINFVIRPLYQFLCRFVAIPIENTLIVNLLISKIDKGFSVSIPSAKYVTNPTAELVSAKFQNLKDLSLQFKNHITFPTRTTVLAEVGINYASLPGLPSEIKLKVLKFLTAESLLQLSETCQDMYSLTCDQSLWRYFMFRDFPFEAGRILQRDGHINWKEKYITKYKSVKKQERSQMRRQTLAHILPVSMTDVEIFPYLLERPFGIGRQSRRKLFEYFPHY